MEKIIAVMAVLCSLVFSNAQNYQANLDGLQEVPPNASPAFGLGDFTLSGTNLSVTTGTYVGLVAGSLFATVQDAAPGVIGPKVFNFTLDTLGTTTGTFSGTGGLTAAQIIDLNAGNLYINIRSSSFLTGEIRGQILPVPEPTSLALFGAGSLLLLAKRRKKV